MTQEELERLAASDNWKDRWRAAKDPDCPPALLERLTKDPQANVVTAAVTHPQTPEETLMAMAEDKDTPATTLISLSLSEHFWVRRAVAENLHAPNEALTHLARESESVGVRESVAGNPSTSETLLRWLYQSAAEMDRDTDWDSQVRIFTSLAQNLATPADLLDALSEDVAEVRKAVADNPRTPERVLKKLAGDESEAVRGAVAGNPSTPERTLRRLAEDDHHFVRYAVATNPSAPDDALEILVSDSYGVVRNSAYKQARHRESRRRVETAQALMQEVASDDLGGLDYGSGL